MKLNKYRKKKIIKAQILLKYFSIKSGNDNLKLEKEIENLINQLKQEGLKLGS